MLVNGKKIRYLSVAEKTSPFEICEEEVNLQKRWIFLKRLISLFWKRGSTEYLTTLQTRRKWNRERNANLEEGDIVFVTDENTPPPSLRLIVEKTKVVELSRLKQHKESMGNLQSS